MNWKFSPQIGNARCGIRKLVTFNFKQTVQFFFLYVVKLFINIQMKKRKKGKLYLDSYDKGELAS